MDLDWNLYIEDAVVNLNDNIGLILCYLNLYKEEIFTFINDIKGLKENRKILTLLWIWFNIFYSILYNQEAKIRL